MGKVLLIVLALCVVGGVSYGIGAGHISFSKNEKNFSKEFGAAGKNVINQTLADIAEKSEGFDEEYQSVSMLKAANALTDQALADASEQEQLETAAGALSGYIARNTLGLKEYCIQLGVDLSNFAHKFRDSHKTLERKARKYYVIEDQVEAAYAAMRAQVLKLIDQEMADFASINKLTSKTESCQLMNDSADVIISRAHFKNVLPSAFKVLDQAK